MIEDGIDREEMDENMRLVGIYGGNLAHENLRDFDARKNYSKSRFAPSFQTD